MATCPNGAEPLPGHSGTSVMLSLQNLGGTLLGLLEGFWPALLSNMIVGSASIDQLCANNPLDPGDLTPQYFFTDLTTYGIVSPGAPVGSLGRYLWDKLNYVEFQANCRCKVTLTPPPPPVVINYPPGMPTYPPGEDNKDQLSRIEDTLSGSSDGLLTLYHGTQLSYTTIRDLWMRMVSGYVDEPVGPVSTVSGEGWLPLQQYEQIGGGFTQDALGIHITLTAIPPSVARRGTLNPRLYGVGSIEWDADSTGRGGGPIVGRHSIHYEREVAFTHPLAQTFGYYYRLVPGVVAQVAQIVRYVDAPIYSGVTPFSSAYSTMQSWNPPAGWSDKPFYPRPAAARAPRSFPTSSPTAAAPEPPSTPSGGGVSPCPCAGELLLD